MDTSDSFLYSTWRIFNKHVQQESKLMEIDDSHPTTENQKTFITDLPIEILRDILLMSAKEETSQKKDFTSLVHCRKPVHFYNLNEEGTGTLLLKRLLSMGRVCQHFKHTVESMKVNVDFLPININILIKGDEDYGRRATLYKYGGTGSQIPAVFLRRFRHLEEHINFFENVKEIDIRNVIVDNGLCDALMSLELSHVTRLHFYDMVDFDFLAEASFPKLTQLLEKLKHAKVEFHFQKKVDDEVDEEVSERMKLAKEMLSEYIGSGNKKHQNRRNIMRPGMINFGNRVGSKSDVILKNFLKEVQLFKRNRMLSITRCVVSSSKKLKLGDIQEPQTFKKAKSRIMQQLKNRLALVGAKREEKLAALREMRKLMKIMMKKKRLNEYQIQKCIRELIKRTKIFDSALEKELSSAQISKAANK